MSRFKLLLLCMMLSVPFVSRASDYQIDTKDTHAFIQFRISHLGYSWLLGQFKQFEGRFTYDENDPQSAKTEVVIDTASLDTNHAVRDKHLRSDKFLDTDKYPKASFVSTGYTENADGSGELSGNLTLKGVTRPIVIKTKQIGHGMDPWGGYRQGFEGEVQLKLKDYGIDFDLGPASTEVYLSLYVEGIRDNQDSRRPKR